MASTEQRKIQIIADGTQVNATFNDMTAAARLLQNQLKKLSPESEEFAKKSQQLKGVKKNMDDLKPSVFGTQKALQGMNQEFLQMTPFGGIINGLTAAMGKGKMAVNLLATGFKTLRGALISTGIGALLVGLGLLINYLTSTQDGIDKVNKVLTPMRVIFEKLQGVVQNLGGNLFKGLGELLNGDLSKGFNTLKDGASQAGAELSSAFTDGIEQGSKLAEMNIKIQETENKLLTERARLNKAYEEAREIAQDQSKSEEVRLKAARDAQAAQDELLNQEQNFIDMKIERMEMEQSFNDTSRADEKELQQLVAERTNFEAQAASKRMRAKSVENTISKQIHADNMKRLDEQRKAEEENQARLAKLRADYVKASIEAEQSLEDLRISVMDEGLAKKAAKLDIDLERELAKMEERRQAIIDNETLTEEEKQKIREQFAEMAELKRQERKEKQAEIEAEEREADIDKQFDQFDEDQERETLLFELSTANAITSEYDKKEKLLQIQREYAAEKLAILEAAGQGETNQALKLKASIASVDKELADIKIEEAQRAEDFKRQIQEAGLEATRGFLQLGLDLLEENSKARKVVATATKAFDIAKVISNGITEIQGYWSTSGPIPFVGPALATGLSIAAGVRTAAAVNKIRTTKYASGGATGSGRTVDMMMGANGTWSMPDGTGTRWVGSYANGGHVGSPSFGVIGEKGSEWVGPNWMLRSPKYADIFGYLEAERQRATPYAAGGVTSMSAPQTSGRITTPGSDMQAQQMMAEFRQLRAVMEDMRGIVATWPDRLRVYNDPRDILSGIQVLNDIESDSRINR